MEEHLKWIGLVRPGATVWLVLDEEGSPLSNDTDEKVGWRVFVWQEKATAESFIRTHQMAQQGTLTEWSVDALLTWAQDQDVCWAIMNLPTAQGPIDFNCLLLPSLKASIDNCREQPLQRRGAFSNN